MPRAALLRGQRGALDPGDAVADANRVYGRCCFAGMDAGLRLARQQRSHTSSG